MMTKTVKKRAGSAIENGGECGKTLQISHENREVDPYVGQVDNSHPNAKKINSFVRTFFRADYDARIHLRDAISYARMLKRGLRRQSREGAVRTLIAFSRKYRESIRLTAEEVKRIVDFVYDDAEL